MKQFYGFAAIAVVVIVGGLFMLRANVSQIDSIKIGAMLSLSGELGAWGENAKKGIELAVIDFKKEHPEIPVEVFYEDTHGDPKVAISTFQRLQGNVDGLIGPLTMAEMAAVAPLLEQQKIPTVSPSFAPLSVRPNPRNPLLLWIDPATEVERLAKDMWNKGIKNVAIIGTDDPWEKAGYDAFIKEYEKLGGMITDREVVGPTATDTKTEVYKMVNSHPDAVFVCTYYQFVNSLRALSTYKYQGKMYGVEIDTYLVEQTKGISNGLQFVAPDFYTSEFVERFNKQFGEKPSIPAGQAYDNMSAILSMFEEYKTQGRVLQAMKDFKEWNGVSGKIEVTSENKTMQPTALFEVKDGSVVRLGELK